MSEFHARLPVEVTLSARVVHADGSVTDHGVISTTHRNPLRRLVDRLRGIGHISLGR